MDDWLAVEQDSPVVMEKVGPLDLPRLGAMIADTHAHLVMLEDPAGALERATLVGVMLVCTVADVTEAPEVTFEGLPAWLADTQVRLDHWEVAHGAPPEVKIIVGVHPHNAKGFDAAVEARLVELAADDRVCAIGEAGLDFHYDYSPRDDQRRAFRAQLELAQRVGLPAVVHLREAHEEGLAALEEVGVPEAGCVIHCFGEGPELAERFVALGCHVSFAGTLTFSKAQAVRAAAAVVPLDRALVETDCPFLAPDPHRGRTNEPAFATLTAAKLAEVKGLPTSAVASQEYLNAHLLFARREAGAER